MIRGTILNLSLAALTTAVPSYQIFSRSSSNISSGCQQACALLSTSFPTSLHYPAADNFTIWDAKQQAVVPSQACRVTPASPQEVSSILSTLVKTQCHFAVKCGGHSREAGDSVAIAGVTIDLNPNLSNTTIAEDGLSARVGGGANLLQTYTALGRRGLSFVGGRVATVGVGGYTLGGGTSPFANKFGWSLDNVYEYEVVLANSTITTAAEDKNPDLYWALRGGGNNFGIVTTFTVRTFEQGNISRGSVSYNDNQTEPALDAIYDLFTDPEASSDVNMGFDMRYGWDPATGEFSMGGTQWYDEPIQNPPVFDRMNNISTARRTTNLVSWSSAVGGAAGLGTVRHLFATLSILPSRALLSEATKIFKEEINAISTVAGLAPNLICYSLPTNAIEGMSRRGGNALGIKSDEPLIVFLVSTGWSDPEGDAAVGSMTHNVVDRLQAAAEAAGRYHPYKYLNYASAEQAPTIYEGYGEENMQRLIAIQKAVDPDGVFTSSGLWRGWMKLV